MARLSYRRHRFPPTIIQHAIWRPASHHLCGRTLPHWFQHCKPTEPLNWRAMVEDALRANYSTAGRLAQLIADGKAGYGNSGQ
jgi:hypothetical protein